MNKGELVALMSELANVSKTDAGKALDMVIEGIIEAMSRGEEVNLVGFGTFSISERAAREGRNPKTGEKMDIAAYFLPTFKAGSKIKEACNPNKVNKSDKNKSNKDKSDKDKSDKDKSDKLNKTGKK